MIEENPAIRLDEMKWPAVAALLKKVDYAILPIGALEAHGLHLPIGTDVYVGEYLGNRLAQATQALLLPAIRYTPAWSLRFFPGTICLTDDTLVQNVVEIADSLSRYGIRTVYALIAHWGALAALKNAERRLLDHPRVRLVNLALPGLDEAIARFCHSKRWHPAYVHAEEFETSVMLAIRPDLVDMDQAVVEYPEKSPLFGPISIPWSEMTKSGTVGDATAATAETGRAILDFIEARALELIRAHQNSLHGPAAES